MFQTSLARTRNGKSFGREVWSRDNVRAASGGSFLAVTCGNGHIALAGLINSFWCRTVWDSVIAHLSLWEIMSDLAVTNIRMENHGVESLWAAPAGLTATAHDALEKSPYLRCTPENDHVVG